MNPPSSADIVASDLAVLREAARIVRSGWTRGACARDAEDASVAVESPRAVRWCASGALEKASGSGIQAQRLGRALRHRVSLMREVPLYLSTWNDNFAACAEDVALLFEQQASDCEGASS